MSTARDIIESVLGRPSVFKSKEKLYPEHVPGYLPHREEQLKRLAEYFRSILIDPGSISQRVLLVGGIGTGKTVTSRRFGIDFKLFARQRGIRFEYVHVNCHRDRTLFLVIQEIAKQLRIPVPQRGLSAQEMFSLIIRHLEEKDKYVIIALDEFDYFIETAGSDAVYFLVRMYDEHPSLTKRVNYIFIARDLNSLSRLDAATESYLIRNVIYFKPYVSNEIYDIVKLRAAEAFHEGTIDDEVFKYIADIVGHDKGGSGNARHALELLLLAGEEADREGSGRVSVEHVRRAHATIDQNIAIVIDNLNYLQLHELLLLLATIRVLKSSGQPYVRIGDVEREYRGVCEDYGERPRRHTQVYDYVMNLKRLGIIDARVSGKGFRGKSTLIGINIGPLDLLEEKVMDVIEKRRLQ
ncbi:MAG: ORC1-type DNA replication protein [Pyrodictiaceae archaeon]